MKKIVLILCVIISSCSKDEDAAIPPSSNSNDRLEKVVSSENGVIVVESELIYEGSKLKAVYTSDYKDGQTFALELSYSGDNIVIKEYEEGQLHYETTFYYDYKGRLVKSRRLDNFIDTYLYDVNDQLIKETIRPWGDTTGTQGWGWVNKYYYSSERLDSVVSGINDTDVAIYSYTASLITNKSKIGRGKDHHYLNTVFEEIMFEYNGNCLSSYKTAYHGNPDMDLVLKYDANCKRIEKVTQANLETVFQYSSEVSELPNMPSSPELDALKIHPFLSWADIFYIY